MCSTRVLPERGIPTTKMGEVLGHPAAPLNSRSKASLDVGSAGLGNTCCIT
jgi:hypothetical protein